MTVEYDHAAAHAEAERLRSQNEAQRRVMAEMTRLYQQRRDAVMAALDRFQRNLAFTAPELTGMRIRQLREEIASAFDDAHAEDEGADQ